MKDKIAFLSLFDKKYTIDVNQYNKKAKDIPYCLSGFLLSYDYVLVFCTILISDGFFDIDAAPVGGLRGLILNKVNAVLDILMAPFAFTQNFIKVSSDWLIILPTTFFIGVVILALYKLITKK